MVMREVIREVMIMVIVEMIDDEGDNDYDGDNASPRGCRLRNASPCIFFKKC